MTDACLQAVGFVSDFLKSCRKHLPAALIIDVGRWSAWRRNQEQASDWLSRSSQGAIASEKGWTLSRHEGWVAGIALVAVLAMVAGIHLARGSQGASFSIERDESAVAAEVAESASAETPSQDKDAASASDGTSEDPPTVVVHVDGMVASPGVYQLQGATLRINDAVEAAGGLVEGADTSRLNLAEPISDGEKVHVPAVGEEDATAGEAAASLSGESSGSGPNASTDGIVNINTATVAELTTLPGVGDATAAEIVRDREANGAFTSIEDLMRVSGIGEKKFAKLKDKIRV